MARPQEFDHEEVLQNAMRLFWRQGFEATSIKDLTEATKLQPGSLYAAFKSKRNLFLLSLDEYFADLLAGVTQLMQADSPPLKRIEQFFNELIKESAHDKELKGCLLVNTLLEIPADDEEINNRVASMLQTIEQQFRSVLEQAQASGELAEDKDPAALASTLISGVFGMRVYNRMNKGKKGLNAIVDNLLSLLQ